MANSSPGASGSSPRQSIHQSGPSSPITPALREWTSARAPHLPFRRISLTPVGAPPAGGAFNSSTSSHRVSVASAGSFDSMPEDEAMAPPWMHKSDTLSPPPPRATSRLSERKQQQPMQAQAQQRVIQRRPSSSGSVSSIELSAKMRLPPNLRPSRSQRSRSRIAVHRPLEELHNAKRLKVMTELWETEKAYVEGLELVYSHFLTPLITSLSDSAPLLSRPDLTTIFSNFVDIWNLHRSLLSHLDEFFARTQHTSHPPTSFDDPTTSEPSSRASTRPNSIISASSSDSHQQHHHHAIHDFLRILVSHFPYLSMYNPFVTAFPSSLSLLTALSTPPPTLLQSAFPRPTASAGPGVRMYEPRFAAWLKDKEADPSCRRLKLRDWMLTVIQRCPRYLLLIKELLGYTSMQDPEYRLLLEVTGLITKVTTTLNQSLAAHAQIMSLISLQKATPNLPFSLVVPGRTLLRRATMIKVDRGSDRRVRDLLLFSDCLVWISRGGEREDWGVLGEWASAGLETGQSVFRDSVMIDHHHHGHASASTNNPESRSRRQSHDVRLATVLGQGAPPATAHGVRQTGRLRSRSDADLLPVAMRPSTSTTNLLPSPDPSLLRSLGTPRDEHGEEKWWYRGRAELLDIEIVVSPIISSPGEERMLEVMSPEGSFALYTESQAERDAWVHAIRDAKAARLVSFQVTHPNTTLTSSNSNQHLRRALQALPHDPTGESSSNANGSPSSKSKKQKNATKRAKVEHFVPAIWVPDQKTETCMRCNSSFGWRRRRHHCRLCGRVVCASCSDRTFYIADTNDSNSPSTPARACNACYETVFPVLPDDAGALRTSASASGVSTAPQSAQSPDMRPTLSMPSLALAIPPLTTPMLPSISSFSSRLRGASFLRSKRARGKAAEDGTIVAERPGISRARSTASTISTSSDLAPDSGTASITTDDGSQWLSSTGGSSGAAFPDSLPNSSTVRDVINKLAFPTVGAYPSSPTHLPGNFPPSTPIIGHADLGDDENGTVGPRRSQDSPSRIPVREMPFDPDVTPRPTARKQDRWSFGGVLPASLPMPDFDPPPTGSDLHTNGTSVNPAEFADPTRAQGVGGEPGESVPDLPAADTLRALPPRQRRTSVQFAQDPHPPSRGYRKRISIAPFPNPAPQALPVHDTPVTARTRVQGNGKARRYSLMLGGTVRGPPSKEQLAAQSRDANTEGTGAGAEVESAPSRVVSQGCDPGAWNAEGARQATRGDVDVPPSHRSYSLRNGVAISKLAELLGRDRQPTAGPR